jgi:Ca2+-binding RTX toxin-like protein
MASQPVAGKRGALEVVIALAALLTATLVVLSAAAGTAEAKRIKGTSGADQLKGTKKRDVLKGRGGNDNVNALDGNDRASGGAGNDTVNGGGGKDAIKGGGGDDLLDAVDGAVDKKVNGGPGTNTCRLDQVDLPIATGCSKIEIPPGGVPPGDGDGGVGGLPPGSLTLTSGTGLKCGSSLPTCVFTLNGSGADADVGTVTGREGVTAAGGAVSVQSEEGTWTAGGGYGCTANGFLHVEIGTESVDVPITCTTH